jgi:hypothetical protein
LKIIHFYLWHPSRTKFLRTPLRIRIGTRLSTMRYRSNYAHTICESHLKSSDCVPVVVKSMNVSGTVERKNPVYLCAPVRGRKFGHRTRPTWQRCWAHKCKRITCIGVTFRPDDCRRIRCVRILRCTLFV